ncbi:MAG: hypothetical protein PUH88_09830 [Lachnospiraceae bacterium]|nr:hypothetical protein [Lachnospiraceae bacterium]
MDSSRKRLLSFLLVIRSCCENALCRWKIRVELLLCINWIVSIRYKLAGYDKKPKILVKTGSEVM